MITTTRLFFALAALLFAAEVNAQCSAGFTAVQTSNNVIAFTNTSQPIIQNSTWFMWDFGDQQNDYSQSPTHTYSAPGNYLVCLTMWDSLSNCQMSFCDTVTVTGNVLCNMWCVAQQTTQPSCSSCADGVATVGVVNGTAPFSFQWSTGATTQSISNLMPGLYTVCVTDANGCTACDSVYLSYPVTTCSITFNPTVQSNGWVDFNDYATWSNNVYPTVAWNFGDATTGTGLNQWHQYATSGTYYVCVTLYDSSINCTASYCDSVVVNLAPLSQCNASFTVVMDSLNTNQAWIYNMSTGSPNMQYQWIWGDNTPGDTTAFPQHVYTQTGTYTICLIVVDQANNCTDTMCQSLFVARYAQSAQTVPFYVNVVAPLGVNSPGASTTWTLFPNPAHDEITVNMSQFNGENFYAVTDMSGRVVNQGPLLNARIDISTLDKGAYFFTVTEKNGTVSTKMFIRN